MDNTKAIEQYFRIKELCDAANMTVSALSAEIAIPKSTFTGVKSGRVKSFSTDTLLKIASYFDVSIDYLVTGHEPKCRITDSDVKKYLFGDEEVTDEMWKDLKAYAEMLVLKNRHEKDNK